MKRMQLDAAGQIVEMPPTSCAPIRTSTLPDGTNEGKLPFLTRDPEENSEETISNSTQESNSKSREADVNPSSSSGNKTSGINSTLTEELNRNSGETEVAQSSSSGSGTTEPTSTLTEEPNHNLNETEVASPSSSGNKSTTGTTSESTDQSNPNYHETEVTPSSPSGNRTPGNLIRLELWWDGKERKYFMVTDEQRISEMMYHETKRYVFIKVIGNVASAETSECTHLKPIRWMYKNGAGVDLFIVKMEQYKKLIREGYKDKNMTIGYAVEKQGLCGANHHVSEYQYSHAGYHLIQTDNSDMATLKSRGYYEKRISFYMWKL
ncbi:hypothetical protein D918_06255 [Trichuris suis]|nr:hypothetical protein D918_06255 [Trichuris suis]